LNNVLISPAVHDKINPTIWAAAPNRLDVETTPPKVISHQTFEVSPRHLVEHRRRISGYDISKQLYAPALLDREYRTADQQQNRDDPLKYRRTDLYELTHDQAAQFARLRGCWDFNPCQCSESKECNGRQRHAYRPRQLRSDCDYILDEGVFTTARH
jgi:hypothetical protein